MSSYKTNSTFQKTPYYHIVYSFKIPEKPFVDELIQFDVDVNGNLLERPAPMDIELPDCISYPKECEFPVDDKEALRIARNHGIDGTAKSFHWHSEFKTYVWYISMETSDNTGEYILISANSGEILDKGAYEVIID